MLAATLQHSLYTRLTHTALPVPVLLGPVSRCSNVLHGQGRSGAAQHTRLQSHAGGTWHHPRLGKLSRSATTTSMLWIVIISHCVLCALQDIAKRVAQDEMAPGNTKTKVGVTPPPLEMQETRQQRQQHRGSTHHCTVTCFMTRFNSRLTIRQTWPPGCWTI